MQLGHMDVVASFWYLFVRCIRKHLSHTSPEIATFHYQDKALLMFKAPWIVHFPDLLG